jgi:DNA helicase-2/ATP-dependent DNA helicase PcrA
MQKETNSLNSNKNISSNNNASNKNTVNNNALNKNNSLNNSKIHDELNQEKKDILKKDNSILVVANPGTGKTKLLAHKYLDLVVSGIKLEDILCLTFTRKAKKEMEERIIDLLKKNKIEFDLNQLKIHTFHSYALDGIEDNNIIEGNLLRFNIYEYLKEKEVFNYSDSYLLETIVPKIENAIRYIKNYGILPTQINSKKAKDLIEDLVKDKKIIHTKQQLENYFDHFTKIFELYEKTKNGNDYTDILINFLKIKMQKYEWVLVDELQDVNNLEAKIALMSGKKFFTVGDKKQAIFGFQGGSIANFELFKSLGIEEKIVDNFRSTNQILNYAKEFYLKKDANATNELNGLKSYKNISGKKPQIIECGEDNKNGNNDKEKLLILVKKIVKELKTKEQVKELEKDEQLGIIVRTNGQILKYSKILENAGLDFSATFSSSSEEARENIIKFIHAIFSEDIEVIKNSFFTPFFPCEMQKSFELSSNKELTFKEIKEVCPNFFKIREQTKNIADINILFKEHIFPVCFAYGEEYVSAAIKLQNISREAINQLKNISLQKYINYLESADLLGSELSKKCKIVLTTIHKAKGLDYEKVIYLPSKSKDKTNFQDSITEAILKSIIKNYEKSELEEEDLRTDFVAMTRARNELFIMTKKPEEYLNEFSEELIIDESIILTESFNEKQKLAFNLFVNREYEKAKQLLEFNKKWLEKFIIAHFEKLESISYSGIESKADDYFTKRMLRISDFGVSINTGLSVHEKIELFLKNAKTEIENFKELKLSELTNLKELKSSIAELKLIDLEKPYFENFLKIIKQISDEGFELFSVEEEIKLPLNRMIASESSMQFYGKIDAIFKKEDKYLIVDWKTNKSVKDASEHRQQLSLYKKGFSVTHKIPEEKISVAIAFIGLRENLNDGTINYNYDSAQPRTTAINTITKQIETIISWKKNPQLFINELKKSTEDTVLIRMVKEQLK